MGVAGCLVRLRLPWGGAAFGACSNRVLPEAARGEAYVEAGAVAPRANALVVITADDLGGGL